MLHDHPRDRVPVDSPRQHGKGNLHGDAGKRRSAGFTKVVPRVPWFVPRPSVAGRESLETSDTGASVDGEEVGQTEGLFCLFHGAMRGRPISSQNHNGGWPNGRSVLIYMLLYGGVKGINTDETRSCIFMY